MAHNSSTRLAQLEVLAIELHALAPVIVIDLQTIREPHLRSRAQRRVLQSAPDIAEGNRIDRSRVRRGWGRARRGWGRVRRARRAPLGRLAQLQLEVSAADDARLGDLESAIEDRLRKALA